MDEGMLLSKLGMRTTKKENVSLSSRSLYTTYNHVKKRTMGPFMLQRKFQIWDTVFPLLSARALRKYFQKLHGRLLEGGAY